MTSTGDTWRSSLGLRQGRARAGPRPDHPKTQPEELGKNYPIACQKPGPKRDFKTWTLPRTKKKRLPSSPPPLCELRNLLNPSPAYIPQPPLICERCRHLAAHLLVDDVQHGALRRRRDVQILEGLVRRDAALAHARQREPSSRGQPRKELPEADHCGEPRRHAHAHGVHAPRCYSYVKGSDGFSSPRARQ